jgi:hypothetical protein
MGALASAADGVVVSTRFICTFDVVLVNFRTHPGRLQSGICSGFTPSKLH